MKIKEIGGEFALIDRLARIVPCIGKEIIQSIGDDAAVIRTAPDPAPYLLVTSDMLVEDRHFKSAWATPEQIGFKAAECNVSDIAAMGGIPTFMVVALALPESIELTWVEGVYRGLAQSCSRHGIAIVGGDTTQGPNTVISIMLLGSVTPANLCLRSQAAVGDRLMVTGPLGGSAAGLALLKNGHPPTAYLSKKYHEPICRRDISDCIAPLANAMIDISDGLASEVRHVCSQSNVGARIVAVQIPIHPDVVAAGKRLGQDPLDWTLNGGEDYELLFSIAPQNIPQLTKTGILYHEVGSITDRASGVTLILADGSQSSLTGGYNHFG